MKNNLFSVFNTQKLHNRKKYIYKEIFGDKLFYPKEYTQKLVGEISIKEQVATSKITSFFLKFSFSNFLSLVYAPATMLTKTFLVKKIVASHFF